MAGLGIGLSRPINIHGPSRPNYHIPSLTMFLPSMKHNKRMFTQSGLIDLTSYAWSKMVTAPNVTEKRGNIE